MLIKYILLIRKFNRIMREDISMFQPKLRKSKPADKGNVYIQNDITISSEIQNGLSEEAKRIMSLVKFANFWYNITTIGRKEEAFFLLLITSVILGVSTIINIITGLYEFSMGGWSGIVAANRHMYIGVCFTLFIVSLIPLYPVFERGIAILWKWFGPSSDYGYQLTSDIISLNENMMSRRINPNVTINTTELSFDNTMLVNKFSNVLRNYFRNRAECSNCYIALNSNGHNLVVPNVSILFTDEYKHKYMSKYTFKSALVQVILADFGPGRTEEIQCRYDSASGKIILEFV